MTAVVTFDFDTWVETFPEFAGCSPGQGQGFFNRACLLFQNNTCNLAFCSGNMPSLLYLLTSHIAWLNAPRDANGNPASSGQPASAIVGRINTATQGSVSVGADMGDANAGSPSQAWYMQTRFGSEFWFATSQFRTMRYLARPTYVPTSIFPFRR